jgi:hypothetical protein
MRKGKKGGRQEVRKQKETKNLLKLLTVQYACEVWISG